MKSSRVEVSNDNRIRNRDFPWSWAILSYWAPGRSRVNVKDAEDNENLSAVLSCRADAEPLEKRRAAIWIRHGYRAKSAHSRNPFSFIKVVKIDAPAIDDEVCWAGMILRSVPAQNVEVLNIVIVVDPGGVDESMSVFRMKKGMSFNKMLEKIVRMYKRERAQG